MSIIELREYKELKKLYEELTKRYLDLIEEKEDITFKKKNYLEALYLSHFGYLSKAKLQLNIDIRRIKRKISLIQYQINRNENVNLEEIENQLTLEMTEFENQLKEFQSKLDFSQEIMKSELLIPDELKEAKKIFRLLAKKLHPDLNKDVTQKMHNLWNRALRAYDLNDLATLRLLMNIIYDNNLVENLSCIEETKKKIENLKINISSIIEYTEEIKNIFPFNIEENLNDSNWIEKEKEILAKEVKDLKEVKERYFQKLIIIERTYINK